MNVEKALQQIFKQVTGLIIDKTLFRGPLPEKAEYGSMSVLLGDTITSNDNGSLRTRNLQLIGKYDDRDNALAMQEVIDAAFPKWDITQDTITFKAISFRGSIGIFPDGDHWKLSANFMVKYV